MSEESPALLILINSVNVDVIGQLVILLQRLAHSVTRTSQVSGAQTLQLLEQGSARAGVVCVAEGNKIARGDCRNEAASYRWLEVTAMFHCACLPLSAFFFLR